MFYRTALLGIDPYKSTLRPRYRPENPRVRTVFFTQSITPLYCRASPRLLEPSSNCNCVLTNSVGNVIQISIPPVIPPRKKIFFYSF
jgi:hypothetical protein